MNPARWAASTLLTVVALAAAVPSLAQGDAAAPVADLPVTRVVLFAGGVGYFEHETVVTGTQEATLDVATAHMDDLLQSLVLQDLDGGSIRPVRYPARDPLNRILGSYALDLTDTPGLAGLLAQAVGEPVHVDAGAGIDGVIVAVERDDDRSGSPDDAPRTFLTLSTDDGLTRVDLAEVRDLRFEREEVREELAAALAAIAQHRDDDANTVRLRFEGEGERRVRVGYVREMPAWKTSYRLLVNDDGTADLQGWAIFDNATDLDLVDVSVSFVAGRPVSFVTELYEPVHVERPRVRIDTGPQIVPDADAGSVGPAWAEMPAPAPAAVMADDAAAEQEAGMAASRARMAAPDLADGGVRAMAEGSAAGAAFEYRVGEPVTIHRFESAMIPIVQRTVPATALSLYDPETLDAHPLRGVRIVNDTELHLAAGPVTVVGPTGFAGAARLGEVPPGEARILTHAVDLDVRILTDSETEPQQVTSVSLRDGLVQTLVRQRIRSAYTIDAADAAFVVVEHPLRSGYDVVAPEIPPARTPDAARFGVRISADGGDAPPPDATEMPDAEGDAPGGGTPAGTDPAASADPVPTHLRCAAGASCTLDVVEERTTSQSIAVTDLAPDRIAYFLENVELSDRDREALERVLSLGREIAAVERAIASEEARRADIHREQERIRANMANLDRDASLYRRYLADLEEQEQELDAILAELGDLRSRRMDLQDELDDAVRSFGEGATP